MNFLHKLATLVGFAFLPVLVISDTNIHLAKESYESSQQRDLQVPPEADTCFTVHFTTSTLRYSKSIGKFSIAGYGDVPLECQERGAECDITICGRNTLDIDTSSTKMWRFSITGDIGPLVNHKDHPTSGKEFLAGFPTQMGNRASIFQRYQLVKTPANKANEWILTDPFMNLDEEILLEERYAIANDRYTLANLYFATNGEGWEDQDNWMTGIDHCDWEHVDCNSDGWVTELGLDINQLTGPIPQSIGNMVNLESLLLYGNQLTGPIPQSIGFPSNLRRLHLNSNQLTGPIPTPLAMNLELLTLNNNELTGPIPQTIVNMGSLILLSLNYNELTGPIPQTIGDLANLRALFLNNNQLTGPIPQTIGNLVNLEQLNLNDNQLTGSIPETIRNLVNLEQLRLYGNELDPTPEWLTTFCESRTKLSCWF